MRNRFQFQTKDLFVLTVLIAAVCGLWAWMIRDHEALNRIDWMVLVVAAMAGGFIYFNLRMKRRD